MENITLFQKKCFSKILDEIEQANISPITCGLIVGKEENYYKIEFEDFILWIYEDMADIKGKGHNKLVEIFEPPDFNSEEELIEEFVELVKKLIS